MIRMVKETIRCEDMSNNKGEGVVYGLFIESTKTCLIGSSAQKKHNWMQSYKGRVSNYLPYLRKGTFKRYTVIQEAWDRGELYFQPVIRCNKAEKYYYEALMANHFKELGWTVINTNGWNKLESKTRSKSESDKLHSVMSESQSGENNGNSRLFSNEEVLLIRKLHEVDGMDAKELAIAFNVKRGYMIEILNYRKYREVK